MNNYPSDDTQAAAYHQSGYLRRFLLPPLSVIIVGGLLAMLLSQINVGVASTAPLPTEQALTKAPNEEEKAEKGIASLFTPEVQYWEDEILAWSKEYQLNPNLIATVMQIESCGYSRAKSVADAKGLFQVMPQHFSNVDKSYDPEKNAEKGLAFLKKCLNASGSTRLALACYNGGITRAKSPEEDWPYETQRYVYWGLKIYKDAKLYKDYSPRLNEWLNSGGDHLCRLAAREQNGKK